MCRSARTCTKIIMKRISSIIRWTMLLTLVLGFTGCSMRDVEEMGPHGGNTGNDGEGSYLILNFRAGTRATNHPFGGELGDGTEQGHNYENKVDNLCFFIYNDGGKTFNEASPETLISYKAYIDNIGSDPTIADDGTVTFPPKRFHIDTYYPANGDRVIVVINAGDLTYKIKSLADLRNATITRDNTWTSSEFIKDYRSFAMTSCTDDSNYGVVQRNHKGSYEDPFVANVEVERVAARVDWVLPTDADQVKVDPTYGAVYNTDESEGIAGKLYVSDIRMVNENLMPTYLIRRTATEVNPLSQVTYMGKVTLSSKELPQQYVVEPRTTQKNASTDVTQYLDTWYQSTFESSKDPGWFFPTNNTYKVGNNAAADKRFTTDDGTCYTLGYLMENTMDKSAYNNPNLRTGLQLKCVFLPSNIWKYPEGETSLLPVEGDYYKIGCSFCYLKNTVEPTKSLFFVKDMDAKRYLSQQSDRNNYEIYNYPGGICYYYIWLKHAACDNSSDEGTYPMEYAIVRNNIYRIRVEKVLHLGTVAPEDVKEELIRVRQWNLREQPEIHL